MSAASTTRDPWLDNAKVLLVVLVVLGHSWTLLPSRPAIDQFYDWLYLWHIPAFVLVTGYLSRRMEWTRAKIWQNVRTLAVPYLLFEAAMALFRIYVGGENLADLWLDPHWPLWYLAAVFVWRMAAPALRAIPAALLLSVALSAVVGLLSNDVLDYVDVARVLGFLPFFVVGLKIRPEHLGRRRRPAAPEAGTTLGSPAAAEVVRPRGPHGVALLPHQRRDARGRHLDGHRAATRDGRGGPGGRVRVPRPHTHDPPLVQQHGRRHDDRLPVPRLRREGRRVRRLRRLGPRPPVPRGAAAPRWARSAWRCCSGADPSPNGWSGSSTRSVTSSSTPVTRSPSRPWPRSRCPRRSRRSSRPRSPRTPASPRGTGPRP